MFAGRPVTGRLRGAREASGSLSFQRFSALAREPAPEDDCRRRAVDLFAPDPPPAAVGPARLESRARFQRGPALIDHADGKLEAALQLVGEPAGSRGERSRGAVDIIRRADDE